MHYYALATIVYIYFFTPVSQSFSVSSVVLLSFKYQQIFFLGKKKKKYSSHWNSVKEEALWRLLWKRSANRSDSCSTGLNSPSQSCQNVSSLVSPLSFTYASCARSAGRARVAWWNLAAAGKASVSPGLLGVWRCVLVPVWCHGSWLSRGQEQGRMTCSLISTPLLVCLSRSLQGCQSPAQPTGSGLEPWRRDQTAIPHLNASLLLLIGGNCLPDARALVRLLLGVVVVVVVVWQQGRDD